jgi:hypothetical protein
MRKTADGTGLDYRHNEGSNTITSRGIHIKITDLTGQIMFSEFATQETN